MNVSHSTKLLVKNIVKKENLELDEFLETEKMVQNQNLTLKVSVQSSRKPAVKPVGVSPRVVLHKNISQTKVKPQVIEINLASNGYKSTQNVLKMQESLEKHRKFIIKSTQRHFSKSLVLRFIFNIWHSFAQATKPKIIGV
jgi:hypothetical protein